MAWSEFVSQCAAFPGHGRYRAASQAGLHAHRAVGDLAVRLQPMRSAPGPHRRTRRRQDRRAPGLRTCLLAAAATNRDIAGALGALGGNRWVVTRPVTDSGTDADAIKGAAPLGWAVPRQPTTMVTAKTRMARTANRAVRGRWPPAARPRVCLTGPLATARIYWKRTRDRRQTRRP
jgi:hypothetical protein